MDYKPFLPASLLEEHGQDENGTYNHDFKNFSLKTGVILKATEVDDEKNVGKISVEYDVSVYEQDEDRGVTQTIYKGCTFLDSFGGIADFMEVRRRAPENQEYKTDLDSEKQNGALVLMLCIDGVADKGIIIGALSHPKRKNTLTKDAEMHLEGEFNGLNWQINKDGELVVTFKSASDNDGKYADEEAGGTFVKIEKDGSVEVNDAKTESIRIDKTEETIDLKAAKDISNTTDANFNITAKENLNVKVEKDWMLEAMGKADLRIRSIVDITAEGTLTVKAPDYNLLIENSMFLKTNTFFMNAERAILNNQITTIGPDPIPAVYLQTMYLGIGNLAAPVISFSIGPFSSTVYISS